jgi:hypothetical protein
MSPDGGNKPGRLETDISREESQRLPHPNELPCRGDDQSIVHLTNCRESERKVNRITFKRYENEARVAINIGEKIGNRGDATPAMLDDPAGFSECDGRKE